MTVEMSKKELIEKLLPLMQDDEVIELMQRHYEFCWVRNEQQYADVILAFSQKHVNRIFIERYGEQQMISGCISSEVN